MKSFFIQIGLFVVFKLLLLGDAASSASRGQGDQDIKMDMPRYSFIPPLPEQMKFDPINYSFLPSDPTSPNNLTLYTELVITGFGSFKDELTYNCLTRQLQLALLVPTLNIQGAYRVAGNVIYGQYLEMDVNGLITLMGRPNYNGEYLLVADGIVRRHERPVIFDYLQVGWLFEPVQFSVEEGTLNGQPIDETNYSQFYLLMSGVFSPQVKNQISSQMAAFVEQLFVNMTVPSLIERTGGHCVESLVI